jgi:hypothetical protein
MKNPIKTTPPPIPQKLSRAQDPHTAPEELRALAHEDPALAHAVAQNPSAPPELLSEMATSAKWQPMIFNPPYDWRLGHNKWTHPSHYTWTFSSETRRAVAQNPNTPPETVFRLAALFPEAAKNPSLSLALLEKPHLLAHLPPVLLLLLYQQPVFCEMVKQSLPQLHPLILSSIEQDSRTPPELKALVEAMRTPSWKDFEDLDWQAKAKLLSSLYPHHEA